MKIYGIKTKEGFLLSDKPNETYSSSYLKNYYINGEKPEATFHQAWIFTKEEPIKFQKLESRPNINQRYELIDKSLESEKFPLIFKREEVVSYDEDGDVIFSEDFKQLRSLYESKSDPQEDILVDVEFEYEQIAEVDEVLNPEGFSYTVLKDPNWSHMGNTNITENSVQHQLVDKIMFPRILLNNKPCKFTSEQMYEIVCQYIKQHINYDVAEISSDYRFCFQVNKKIKLNETKVIKDEIMKSNGRPYRSPKYNTRYISDRKVKLFEMTHAKENYKGYTPIPEMIGENIQDLKAKVDKYCQEIIDAINRPLVDCPHCQGTGVVK